MQTSKDKSQRSILSAEQKRAIAQFREEEIRIKNELKTVRKNLRMDIEQLGIRVKVANIALMPLVVAVAGISYGIYRRKKR
ncbi:MAG: ABC transporter, partial [Kiritimatiellae bacterium]|nr:ABC transporter [Kiritimatiellia bacterium]